MSSVLPRIAVEGVGTWRWSKGPASRESAANLTELRTPKNAARPKAN